MTLLLKIDSTELTDFIHAVKEGISKTEKDGEFTLLTPIDFEISIAVTKEGKGKVNIAIVDAGGKYEKESITKIRFSMGNPSSLEQLEKVAKLFQISSKVSNENLQTAIEGLKLSKN